MTDILSIASTGILAAQQSLETIANNISNASTPGYSRQNTLLTTNPLTSTGGFYVGAGAKIQGIQRVADSFVTNALRNQQTLYSSTQSYGQYLTQIDNYLSDPSLGLLDGIGNVFSALQEVVNDADSIPARQVLISQAQILANNFNTLGSLIDNFNLQINEQISKSVEQINQLTTQLAQCNLQIKNTAFTNAANAPNSLLDLQDQLLLEISEYIGISSNTLDDGTVDVFTTNGQSIVIGANAYALSTQQDAYDPQQIDIYISSFASQQNITNGISGGTVGGLLDIREVILPQVKNSIGLLAISLAMTMNAQHHMGIDLNGNLGLNLFNDPNDYESCLNRVLEFSNNLGNGLFSVNILPISPPTVSEPVFSNPTALVNAGTLPPLYANILAINNIKIRATTLQDDLVSTTDPLASALAIATAINSQSAQHLVLATAQPCIVYLGQFAPGQIAAGNLVINGINIVSSGVDEATLLRDINALSTQTGVIASGDDNLHITLVAQDGRNIQLAQNVPSGAANFSYFDMQSASPLNLVQKSTIQLQSLNDAPIIIGGVNPQSVNFTQGEYPNIYSSLTNLDYELTYDGTTYTLLNYPEMTMIAQSSTPNFSLAGISISLLSGTVVAGDSYRIQPTRNGANNLSFVLSSPTLLAMACPIETSASLSNQGNGQIALGAINNVSGQPPTVGNIYGNAFSTPQTLSPPILIEFTSPTTYQVFDYTNDTKGNPIGPVQTYNPGLVQNVIFPIDGVVNTTLPGPNLTYLYDPGYQVIISGQPQANDTFTIGYNLNSVGDNRNAINLANLQFAKIINNNSATYQDSYAQLVGSVGSLDAQGKLSLDSNQSVFLAMQSLRNQISAVNLDEEATNLIQFEQAYRASAQVVSVARSIFDSFMRIMGG